MLCKPCIIIISIFRKAKYINLLKTTVVLKLTLNTQIVTTFLNPFILKSPFNLRLIEISRFFAEKFDRKD